MVFSIKSLFTNLLVAIALLTSSPLFPSVVASFEIMQIGADIDGESGSVSFGWSTSMSSDGTTFVASALSSLSAFYIGDVRVYKFNSTTNTYTQVGSAINGENQFDRLGMSLSISADGSTFVVGAPWSDGIAGIDSGHVRVYKFNSTINTYAQVGLDIDGEAASDLFGWSVSISADGTTFVAGAPGNNGINGSDSGHVRVYMFNSTINTYAQFGLDIDGETDGDNFGRSVSMSADGTTFVVGAPFNNDASSGHVRVYKFNSTINTYAQVGLDIEDDPNVFEYFFEYFGWSVSISGDGTTFVVGAPGYGFGCGRFGFGGVRVYKFNSTINTYSQVGSFIDSEADGSPYFGTSVSMSGDGTTFVVGAPFTEGDAGAGPGHILVYEFNSTINTYVQVGLDIDGEADGDSFGWSVSLSADATTFVVGARYNDGANGTDSGHVRVYSTGVVSPRKNCGIFGWNVFCPRRGKCGLLKRLLNLGNCD